LKETNASREESTVAGEPNQAIELSELRELWQRWAALIAHVAGGRTAGKAISSQDYRMLYIALLQACRKSAEAADESMRASLGRLEQIVAPWVRLESVASADRKLLTRLMEQCDEAGRVFSGRASSSARRRPAVRRRQSAGIKTWLIVFAVGILLGVLVLRWIDSPVHSDLRYDGQILLIRLKFAVLRAGFLKVFSVIAVVVVIIGGMLMYSTKKS
jgi:hypothetical protein